jgi:hypothetical protein
MIFNYMSRQEMEAEFDRIDADEHLRSGFGANAEITPEDVATALRTTPTGGGTPAFLETLKEVVRARREGEEH